MNEMNRDEANLGIVNISDEVIGVVAGIAASEIDGILEINHNNSTGIGHKFSKKSLGKGIKVNVENIEIGVTVQYGIKIPDVVSQVQENVRRTVEAITGLKVALVNIYVQNIIILKEEDKNEILKK